MKNAFQLASRAVPFVVGLILLALTATAQIPQNIEVEGEPSSIWQYTTYVLVLVAIVLLILIVARLAKGRKK